MLTLPTNLRITHSVLCYDACVPLKDRIAAAAYMKRWRKANAITERPNACRRVAEQRKKKKAFVRSYKDGRPCADCGLSYPHFVMDFDHARGKKSFALSTVHYGLWSNERILAEIAKCDLVCANCHRIRTHNRLTGA